MLNMLGATTLCQRGQTAATAPDLEFAQVAEGITPGGQESSNSQDGEADTNTGRKGKHTLSIVSPTVLIEAEPLKDLAGVQAVSRDPLYFIAKRYRLQTAYVLQVKTRSVSRGWKEVLKAKEENIADLEKMEEKFGDSVCSYIQFVNSLYKFEALPKPNGKLLGNYMGMAKEYLCTEADFLDPETENWILAHPIDTIDLWTKIIPEYAWGRWLLNPFKQSTEEHDGFTTHKFADVVFKVALFIILILLVVTLVGAPVVVQALGVTSVGVNAVLYMVCLFVFASIAQVILRSESTVFLTTLAYAAVVVANLGRGQ